MNKKMTPLQLRVLNKNKEKEIERRFLDKNWDAMRWCNKQGLTIYASSQSYNSMMVKVFVQKRENFKPLNDKTYNQEEIKEVKEYSAAIDAEYERLYLKMKDKV